jgi:hypothetical protein
MNRVCLTAWALFIVLGVPLGVRAQSGRMVKVEVVDIAGGRAYLRPGESAGVGLGTIVMFRQRRYRVVGATSKHAVVEMKERELRIGMVGRARAAAPQSVARALPKPKPLSAYEDQWAEPVLPASKQTPEYVPLGRATEAERVDLGLSTNVGGVIALRDPDSTFGRASLRARMHAEPFQQPFFFGVDFAVRSWFGGNINNRPGDASRPLIALRELQMGYGNAVSTQVALGRLPFVATGVGRLDGARVRTPSFGGFSIGAFGGTVPNPLDYRFTWDTIRFGGELVYENPSLDLQPFAAVSIHASRFMGVLDERRLYSEFGLFPGTGHIAGHLSLALHDKDNIWQAPRFEVSSAGFYASARIGLFQISGRFDMRLPERSLWLTAYLPLGYLCNTKVDFDPTSTTGDEVVVCANSNDARYFGGIDTSFSFPRFVLYAGASYVHSETSEEFDQIVGYLQGRILRIGEIGWADLSLAAYAPSFVSDYAARLGGGVDIKQVAEISAYYRISLNQYAAAPDGYLQQSAGGIVYLSIKNDLDLGLRADGMFGEDVRVLVLSSNLTWRPSW